MYSGVAGEGWHPWDYAAGWLFIEEAGGGMTQVKTDERPLARLKREVLGSAVMYVTRRF